MSPERIHRRDPARAGVVLIIVVGLAMVLLGIAVSFMMRMRADSQETRIVVAEAQCRLMLHAALMYLQEGSRLGWGTETFGWTDVRDGSLGPRGPRDYSPGGAGATIPKPAWFTVGAYAPLIDDAALPAAASRFWPYPGSVGRFPMAVPVQPPFATQLRYAYNPVGLPPGVPLYGQANYETPWITAPLANDPIQRDIAGRPLPTASYWPKAWADTIYSTDRGAMGALDPQPQADTYYDPGYTGASGQKPDFISGAIQQGVTAGDWKHTVINAGVTKAVQLQVKPGTENVCWFRIYRELQSDHDGDGKPAYDRVMMYDLKNTNLKNWNVFVIACGVGGTRGFRFWDAADLNTWVLQTGSTVTPTLGQDFASSSGLFASQADFAAARSSTRVTWYRVEWSALQGGGFVPEHYSWSGPRIYPRKKLNNVTDFMVPRPYPGWDLTHNRPRDESHSDELVGITDGNYADGLRYSAPKTYGGNFKWVQRLDHEPPNW
jgi:hypothetical protein